MNINTLEQKAKWVRRKSFQMQISAGKGHLGGAFSITDILIAIYYSGIFNLSSKKRKYPERDRIIFSKGHACLALYCVLADKGYFPKAELDKHGQNGSILGGHPDHKIPGVEVSSGSLGHGLGIGCGLALAAKLDKKKFSTLVILGDGECNEGSIWEGASFASQQKLFNLTAIIDNNKVAATTFTRNLTGNSSLVAKWKSFGWDVITVNGHSFEDLLFAFSNLRFRKSDRPLMIIANTVKGKGVSFMEGRPEWHHTVPNAEQLEIARQELIRLD